MRKERKKGVIKSKIKRGDEVVFIAGKEYNRYERSENGEVVRIPYRGKVIAVNPRDGKVKVDGAMIVKRHQKANPQLNLPGGIMKREAWVDISNISLIDPKTDKPTRVKIEERDGKKVRVAKSGEIIPTPNPFERVERTGETEEAVEETDAAEETAETGTEDAAEEVKTEEVKAEEVKTEEAKEEKKAASKKAEKKTEKKSTGKKADKSEEE
jgi:large subunit ribosomal protein L24